MKGNKIVKCLKNDVRIILHNQETRQSVLISRYRKADDLSINYSIRHFDNFVYSGQYGRYSDLQGVDFQGFTEWRGNFFWFMKDEYDMMLVQLQDTNMCENAKIRDELCNVYYFDVAIIKSVFMVSDRLRMNVIFENFFNNHFKHLINSQ